MNARPWLIREGRKPIRVVVDSVPEYGWVCVIQPGRSGSVSVPIKSLHLLHLGS